MSHSIKDVANLAGCSISTVSRVLSGNGYISENSRHKVNAAVKKLNYRPNRIARSLRAQKSKVIGLIVSDISTPFFAEISLSVERTALAKGYTVLICNTGEAPHKEALYIELMQEERVAGLIISPAQWNKKTINFSALPPTVCIDRKVVGADVDTVLIDNQNAATRLTQSLLQGGYRNIAGIFGGKDSYTTGLRIEGFKAAFKGKKKLMAAIYQAPPTEEEGKRMVHQALAKDPTIDAFLFGSALLGSGAYCGLRESGLRDPSKLGIACFDDPTWGRCVEPAVTAIHQPAALMGEMATDLLIKRIEAPSQRTTELILRGELMLRASSTRS
ncbi:LacI family DNA-binding transcriptional regulator [Coraliomargarita sp. W4R53]